MRRIISDSEMLLRSTPRALALGLREAKRSEIGLLPINSRSSASVRRSLKKSRSWISAPFCERNSLALRQLDQFSCSSIYALLPEESRRGVLENAARAAFELESWEKLESILERLESELGATNSIKAILAD